MAPTGQVLADLAATLAARGHQAQVVCSRASYEGGPPPASAPDPPGVHVSRLPAPGLGRSPTARLFQETVFLSSLSAAVFRGPRPDLVLSMTTPPFLGLMGRAAANLRGAAHAHWVMDVYPDALSAHGWLTAGGSVFRTLQSLARLQHQGAALVLGLGQVQQARIAPYVSGRAEYVPLWSAAGGPAPAGAIARARAERGWEGRDLVFLYSGNLGRGHRLDEFLEAARRLGAAGPRWAFAGGGPRAAELAAFRASEPSARVQVFPYVGRGDLAPLLGAGDVHLASVRGEWSGLIVPSKVQAAFAAGRPIIFLGGAGNDAASWIEESGGGWRVDEGDVAGLLRAVEAASDPVERERRGQAALAYAGQHFDRAANCSRIAGLLEEAVDSRRARLAAHAAAKN